MLIRFDKHVVQQFNYLQFGCVMWNCYGFHSFLAFSYDHTVFIFERIFHFCLYGQFFSRVFFAGVFCSVMAWYGLASPQQGLMAATSLTSACQIANYFQIKRMICFCYDSHESPCIFTIRVCAHRLSFWDINFCWITRKNLSISVIFSLLAIFTRLSFWTLNFEQAPLINPGWFTSRAGAFNLSRASAAN